jgi:hypothetical protein
METKIYRWETTFDTAARTMTHNLSERVKVHVDFKFGIITIARDGEAIDKFNCGGISLDEYEYLLAKIAESAAILAQM